MKITQYNNNYGNNELIQMAGFVTHGYVRLYRQPVDSGEAATKCYADTYKTTYDASELVGGPLNKQRIIGSFSGDASAYNGVDVALNSVLFTPGSFNSVTVNAKGQITSATNESIPGVTSVTFGEIQNKPTTVSGYIPDTSPYAVLTNGVNTNLSLSGNLLSTVSPYLSNHSTRYGDIQTWLNGMQKETAAVGQLKIATAQTAGYGWAQANGGMLDKTTYSALYAVIGETYGSVEGGVSAVGQPWRQQYAFNTANHGDITGWVDGPTLPTAIYNAQAVVTKDRVYLLGGDINSSASSAVYTAPINADGTLGDWVAGTPLPAAVTHSQAIVTETRIYLLGGDLSGNSVYTAVINADGTLGTWSARIRLPVSVVRSQAVITKDRVYLLGGIINGNYSSTVYTAPITSNGDLGAWTTGTSLPEPVADSQAIVTKDRVYLLGGQIISGHSSTVYTAVFDADGILGSWSIASALPAIVAHSQAIVTKDRAYLLGGYVNGTWSYGSAVFTAAINIDGTLDPWTTGTSLPESVYASHAIVTKDHVHLLGGSKNGVNFYGSYTAQFTGGANNYIGQKDETVGFNQPTLNWNLSSVGLPNPVSNFKTTLIGDKLYLIGGSSDSDNWMEESAGVYYTTVSAQGELNPWTQSTPLPKPVGYHEVLVTKSRVYVIGGYGTDSYDSVYYATINPDNTLDGWVESTPLPATIDESCLYVAGNQVYLVGGYVDGVSSNECFSATIDDDGYIGGWVSLGAIFPVNNASAKTVKTSKRVYVMGGDGAQNAMYSAALSDPTVWEASGHLPVEIKHFQVISTPTHVYLFGGEEGVYGPSTKVYRAKINADGALGSWVDDTSMPANNAYGGVLSVDNYIYLFNGHTFGIYTSLVLDPNVAVTPPSTGDTNLFKLPDLTDLAISPFMYYIRVLK